MSDNLKIWNQFDKPPREALKEIKGGRLSGMTDIKPQWRYKAMTEQFGICGIGWKYTITNKWIEAGSDDQVLCFVDVDLFVKVEDKWSDAIPGTGGSMLVTKEKSGLHTSDEGFKMALTDALSVAMGRLGVAAEIYMGNWTGSKYKDAPTETPKKQEPERKESDVSTKDHTWKGEYKKEGAEATLEVFSIAIKALATKDSAHKWKKENQSAIDSLGADKGKVMTEYLNKVKELN